MIAKPCFSKNRTISLPDRRGSLATTHLGKIPIEETEGGSTQSSHRVLQSESFNITLEGFFQISNRLFFRFTFAIGGDVRNPRSESPHFQIRDDLDRDLVHR